MIPTMWTNSPERIAKSQTGSADWIDVSSGRTGSGYTAAVISRAHCMACQ
jgi:hypothetical protein